MPTLPTATDPRKERLPFSLPSDEVPTMPTSPIRSPSQQHPRLSRGGPLGVPSGSHQTSTNSSPTERIAEDWHRVTGREAPSRDGQMLHEDVADETQDVEESDDDVDDSLPAPPVIVVGSPSQPSSPLEVGPEPAPFDPRLLTRPVLPYARFDEVQDQVHTLLDLVWAALPQSPTIYETGQLVGTKAPTPREYAIPKPDQLKNIVYCVNMLAPIETEVAALLHAIPFDRNNQSHMLFATRVFPWFTSRDSPKRIYSETDTEDWIRDTLIGPAHAVMHAVALGDIPDDVSPAYPFHSSAHCRFINRPDNMTILEGEHPNEVIPHIGEWKTPGVISIDDNPLSAVQKAVENINRAGAAYKFNWPKPSSSIAQRDKILCQVRDVFLNERAQS
ncbi:hypothetical protein EWM64_g8892 [Hericium alpestre]|uniref:Uncharacterized protein n=1 Tax=Hericium alpestre TaxID=135208 RepID=A0A4Y9ZMR3_9AGAM|nr:hypothetical protein EWM64_g8892 [Hericium alpestre]